MQWREAAEDRLLRTVVRVTGRAQRRFIRPCLMDLQPRCEEAFLDAAALIRRLCSPVSDAQLAALEREHDELRTMLEARYTERALAFPLNWAVADATSLALYALTRLRRPRTIVETGVANGHSTYFFLHALARNGTGRLVSFDVSAQVGALLSAQERASLDLRLLPARDRESMFTRAIEDLAGIDLFHHDSLHSYEWQMLEYETIRRCAPEALITSDDVDGSFAFVDFCERHNRKALYLVDPRKVFGIVATRERGS